MHGNAWVTSTVASKGNHLKIPLVIYEERPWGIFETICYWRTTCTRYGSECSGHQECAVFDIRLDMWRSFYGEALPSFSPINDRPVNLRIVIIGAGIVQSNTISAYSIHIQTECYSPKGNLINRMAWPGLVHGTHCHLGSFHGSESWTAALETKRPITGAWE
jgi:hypothetical protein